MSMSTRVIGVKPADRRFHEMKAIYDACMTADIKIPIEVENFFGCEAPDPKGVIIDLDHSDGVSDFSNQDESGVEIELAKLPKDIAIIRVVNSW